MARIADDADFLAAAVDPDQPVGALAPAAAIDQRPFRRRRESCRAGRSDFDSSAETKLDRAGSATAATLSTGAPLVAAAASKAVVRTVTTFTASADCTVAMALPA